MAADRKRVDFLAEFRRAFVDIKGLHHIARAWFHFHRNHLVEFRDDAGGNETNGGHYAGRSPSLLEQTEVFRVHHRRRGDSSLSACLSVSATGSGTSSNGAGEKD